MIGPDISFMIIDLSGVFNKCDISVLHGQRLIQYVLPIKWVNNGDNRYKDLERSLILPAIRLKYTCRVVLFFSQDFLHRASQKTIFKRD